MKGQVRKNPEEFLDNELVIASLDGYGRLQVSVESSSVGGDASAAKQDEQTALLESIDQKQNPQKYLGRATKDITSIPVGGVDLRNLVPGKEPILITGTLTSGSGQLHVNLYDDPDDGSVKIIRNFGSNGWFNSTCGKIFDTTNPAILPLQVFYA